MSELTKVTRRGFLKGTAGIAGTGLVLGFNLPSASLFADAMEGSFSPSVYITIEESGTINLVIPHSEMGQGTRTGLIQILAEELEAKWDDITYTQAIANPKYGDQATVGSYSVKIRYMPFRKAGAAAKEMLIQAAAKSWDVPVSELYAQDSKVIHEKSRREIHYSQLVKVAKTLPVPENPKLKERKDFKYIGKEVMAVDLPDIVQGKAVFGIDVEVPGMAYASLERSPTVTGKIKSYDKAAAMAVKGVTDVVEVPGNGIWTNNAVAVVATNTWAAIKGRKALRVQWDTGNAKLQSDREHRAELRKLVDGKGTVQRSEGDYEKGKARADQVISAYYYSPNLVHSPMEPMVATAKVVGDQAEVWTPTQQPQFAATAVGGLFGHKDGKQFENVTVHTTLVGGGFGRKGKPDFSVEAAMVSKIVGKPVKATWKREDEVKHGFYRGANMQRYEATLDKNGYPTGWKAMTVFPSMFKTFIPGHTEPHPWEVGMGFLEVPYRIDNIHLESKGVKTDIRQGYLRSVTHTFHAWAMNNFVDELAHAAGRDTVDYRLKLLGAPRQLVYEGWDEKFGLPYGLQPYKTGRLSNVLQRVAEQGSWGKSPAEGHALGIAAHKAFNSYVAMVFDVSIDGGKARVHQADIVADIGIVVNPSYVKAQLEGAMVYGLTAALYGDITVEKGTVQQSNFHDYPILRIDEMPQVNVTLVDSDEAPTGIGEPGVTPVAPALCNAIFNLTGKRIYDLPVAKQNFA